MKERILIAVLFVFFLIASVILALNLQTNYLEQGILTFLGFFVFNSYAIISLVEEQRKNWKDIAYISYLLLGSIILWGIFILFIFESMDWTETYMDMILNYANSYIAMLHVIAIVLSMTIGWLCGSMGISDQIE